MKNQSNQPRRIALSSFNAVALFVLAGGAIQLAVACSSSDTPVTNASTGTVNPVGGTSTTAAGTGGAGPTTNTTAAGMGGTSQTSTSGQGGAGAGGKGQGGGGTGGLPAGTCTPFDNKQLPLLGANDTLPPLP